MSIIWLDFEIESYYDCVYKAVAINLLCVPFLSMTKMIVVTCWQILWLLTQYGSYFRWLELLKVMREGLPQHCPSFWYNNLGVISQFSFQFYWKITFICILPHKAPLSGSSFRLTFCVLLWLEMTTDISHAMQLTSEYHRKSLKGPTMAWTRTIGCWCPFY